MPDPKYGSKLVAKFINGHHEERQEELGRIHPLWSFDIIERKTEEDPLKLFEKAMEASSPCLRLDAAGSVVPRIRSGGNHGPP